MTQDDDNFYIGDTVEVDGEEGLWEIIDISGLDITIRSIDDPDEEQEVTKLDIHMWEN